jgi:hypothetical protein
VVTRALWRTARSWSAACSATFPPWLCATTHCLARGCLATCCCRCATSSPQRACPKRVPARPREPGYVAAGPFQCGAQCAVRSGPRSIAGERAVNQRDYDGPVSDRLVRLPTGVPYLPGSSSNGSESSRGSRASMIF